jgi:asparagine synthase (glutamine-hydrolysing)
VGTKEFSVCGIVAVLHLDGKAADAGDVTAMRDMLVHRGPDDCGLFLDGPVGLGHRRLSIIDLGGGHQPMSNAAGTVHIVFNGEIYNYPDLRTHLTERGVQLKSASDTETILGLYDLYGERCVDHLYGMFAFVLWDSRRRRMVIARDRMGIKPLYVARMRGVVAFASEIKAFFALPQWSADVDAEKLPEYLVYRDVAGKRTLFRDVECVLPGQMIIIDADGRESSHTYWSMPLPRSTQNGEARHTSIEGWCDELDALFDKVVREHLLSDVPLGTFNSGGVDSSLVTAYTARAINRPVQTHAVAFDDPRYDESPYARIVAERYGTLHHTYRVNEQEFADLLPHAIWHLDEPLNHPNSIPIASLSRLARENVTVVLTGEGSDELFGGYPRYRLARLLDRFQSFFPVLKPLLAALAFVRPANERARIRAALHRDGVDIAGLAAFVSHEQVRALAGSQASAGMTTSLARKVRPPSVFPETLLYDQQTYLQGLLKRLDKMSMASSLEGRVPFLDHRVVEFAADVPPELKLRGGRTKFLLKELSRRYLPAEIIDRPKAGLAVPVSRWLARGGVLSPFADSLCEPGARIRDYFDGEIVRRSVEEHRAGKHDHGELLWALVNCELWLRNVVAAPARHARADTRPPPMQAGV